MLFPEEVVPEGGAVAEPAEDEPRGGNDHGGGKDHSKAFAGDQKHWREQDYGDEAFS